MATRENDVNKGQIIFFLIFNRPILAVASDAANDALT